jgi:hypothetical protein
MGRYVAFLSIASAANGGAGRPSPIGPVSGALIHRAESTGIDSADVSPDLSPKVEEMSQLFIRRTAVCRDQLPPKRDPFLEGGVDLLSLNPRASVLVSVCHEPRP